MLWNAFLLALREIRRNAMRSILTVLGIVIGVASVIAMVTLGDGTTEQVKRGIAKLGSNLLILAPGQDKHGPGSNDQSAKKFDLDDAIAIKREIVGIKAAAPISSKIATVIYSNENYSTTIFGSDNDYFIAKGYEFEEGEEFSQSELKSGQSVCVIGRTVQKELFGQLSPLGERIRLGSFSCKVKGLLKEKGAATFGLDQDDLVVVPIKMLQRRLTGVQDVSFIYVSVNDNYSTDKVIQSLRLLFRERRNVRGDEEEDFYVRDMKDIIKTLSSTTGTLTMLLGAVAVVLAALGGVIGILLGLLVTYGVAISFDIPFILNNKIILLAFIFSTVIGVVFGYFPAKKAATMNPIDALRHE